MHRSCCQGQEARTEVLHGVARLSHVAWPDMSRGSQEAGRSVLFHVRDMHGGCAFSSGEHPGTQGNRSRERDEAVRAQMREIVGGG